VASCNRFDLVVVPSTYCRWAFLESGVSVPVMVVPHGVGSAFRPRHELVRRTPLIFYNTFHATSVFERKGVDELVSAFLEAFGRDGRDAVLRLRTQVTREMFDLAGRHDFGEAITVMPLEDLDVDSYAALFGLVHCTVHPSRGEGFGLVPLQSIACGTPVIATGATGMDDYLSDSNAIRVRTAGRVAGHSVGNAAGAYHRIDQDHLVGSLQEMHTNWEHHYARTRRAAVGVRERYAWPAVLDSLARVVGEAAGRGDRSGLRRDLAERWGAP
jgi:glycosyltransferase involved in cell wall biosynthesis